MASTLPIPKHSAGRTFVVAMVVLGVLACAQGLAVGWAFLWRYGLSLSLPPTEPSGELARAGENALAGPGGEAVPAFELPAVSGAQPSASAVGEGDGLPAPTPIPVVPGGLPADATALRSPGQTRVAGLVAQARAVREAGDMSAALAKLREALALAPQDPLVLSELAQTYERMGLREKAAEHWKRVVDLGEQAGALLDLAQIKLEAAAPGAEAGEDGEGRVSLRPGRDDEGLQPGSTLGLIDVRAQDDIDPDSLRKVRLRLGLKARSGTLVDPKDVVIQVFFYDLVDGQHIVQTNAEVGSQWTTAPADWADDGIEVLQVTYRQPKVTESVAEPENRRYLGYVVRLYYQSLLQDMQADPIRLLTLYPPPLQLEADPTTP